MKLNLAKELAALEQMTVGQLQQRYADVFGEPVRSRHKQYLIRRIAWRLQANAGAGLPRTCETCRFQERLSWRPAV
jgi:hypothetical protein